MERVRLHRCKAQWVKTGGHPCWRVERALIEQGIDYELVGESYRKGRRPDVERLTNQRKLPVVEFADGTAYRDESAVMAERIAAGRLFEGRGP